MPKSIHRVGRRRSNVPRSRTPRHDGARRRGGSPLQRDTQDPGRLLDRILDTPNLARLVPQLRPEMLHRVIQSCGLEDCGELVALATPDQLARVFDLDLWRTGQPGRDEQLDADRFGVWLEVLVASGAGVAAQKLAAMDVHLVIAALAQHARVFDRAALSPSAPLDEADAAVRAMGDELGCDVGGYLVVATRTDSWDAIVAVLVSLEAEHRDCFHRVMSGCRSLSNSSPEIDGLDDLLTDREQVMFDLAFDREQRREKQGYVTPAQARAFLQMSRQARPAHDAKPLGDPITRAYFRAIEPTTATDLKPGVRRLPEAPDPPPAPEESADQVAAFVDVLLEAGVLTPQPRALLDGPQGPPPRLARFQTHMRFTRECDDAAHSMRSQELAFLSNTLMAGCSIQARPFTAQEASDAAVAVCNLGLENWPSRGLPVDGRGASAFDAGTALPGDFLVRHDLVSVFQVGWTVLHADVCMYAAERLIRVLTRLRCHDLETRAGLAALRIEMTRHWQARAPWRAREALDVMAILDLPAWAALLGLIDECPVIHAGLGASRGPGTRTVSASAFEFISENRQIASVRDFMESLPDTLSQ